MTEEQISCTGKARYLRRAHAKRDASRIRRSGDNHLRPYPCRFCGCWHLGHLPGKATYLRNTIHGPVSVEEFTT
ncbi:hypothetical protein [Streptomyces sp. NPDC046371]|uniref:hypothetical protein n=1 Tax=Streptomyces sp. NPDC046371 TaxID=3154916 RepID=UPI0033C576D1